MTARFVHFDLRVPPPRFDSTLTDVIIELEHLRRLRLGGTTPPATFFELKTIFHLLESLGSARIEGNITTLAEYVERKIEGQPAENERFKEIANMENTMSFIDSNVSQGVGISKAFIRELHKRTVEGLTIEGDRTPGFFRKTNVEITGSDHLPPESVLVDEYMDNLIDFINKVQDAKYDLLKIALAHHRFAWIHPFTNGNGRVVRLLTYAMLIERGFNIGNGRLINPTAVFCSDRSTYYKKLAEADKGTDEGLLSWAEYVLRGLLSETTKVDKLTQYDYLRKHILVPAIEFSRERQAITELESKILKIAVEEHTFKSSDIERVMPGKIPAERSRVLARLRENKFIKPITGGGRKYTISFSGSLLLRGIIHALNKEEFISVSQ